MIVEALKTSVRATERQINSVKVAGKPKYFCVGRNKTGTTSLKRAFIDLGFIVGQQRYAQTLYDKDFFDNEFARIIEFCKTAQVFQDIPFSLKETLEHIDKAFPGSKFILTTRDSTDQWYESITKFHSKKFGKNGLLPTFRDLQNATYVRRGYMTNILRLYGTSSTDIYNRDVLCKHYEMHNQFVRDYFSDRDDDLLDINLSEPDAYKRFTNFINVDSPFSEFPWVNKTDLG